MGSPISSDRTARLVQPQQSRFNWKPSGNTVWKSDLFLNKSIWKHLIRQFSYEFNSRYHSAEYFKEAPSVSSPLANTGSCEDSCLPTLMAAPSANWPTSPSLALHTARCEQALCEAGFLFRYHSLAAISFLPTLKCSVCFQASIRTHKAKIASRREQPCGEH